MVVDHTRNPVALVADVLGNGNVERTDFLIVVVRGRRIVIQRVFARETVIRSPVVRQLALEGVTAIGEGHVFGVPGEFIKLDPAQGHRLIELDAIGDIREGSLLRFLGLEVFSRAGTQIHFNLTIVQIHEELGVLAGELALKGADAKILGHPGRLGGILFRRRRRRKRIHHVVVAGALAAEDDLVGGIAQDLEADIPLVRLVVRAALQAVDVLGRTGRRGEVIQVVIEGIEVQDGTVIGTHAVQGRAAPLEDFRPRGHFLIGEDQRVDETTDFLGVAFLARAVGIIVHHPAVRRIHQQFLGLTQILGDTGGGGVLEDPLLILHAGQQRRRSEDEGHQICEKSFHTDCFLRVS